METTDWLSSLLAIMPVTGSLDIRCHYAAPWRIVYQVAEPGEMRWHVVLKGKAFLDDSQGGHPIQLNAGDIVIFPGGDAHTMHDGSGARAHPATRRSGGTHTISEILGTDDPLDMICGRFRVQRPHDRVMREYLPRQLLVETSRPSHTGQAAVLEEQMSKLLFLMRTETDAVHLGGIAMLNAFSMALFTLSLRLASGSCGDSKTLLALAGNPELLPALEVMIHRPGDRWTLPKLAKLCHVSRATFTRHFQKQLGRRAGDFLLDFRMSMAANELQKTGATTAAIAETVGYQSEAAFQRAFKQKMGVTASQWRKGTR